MTSETELERSAPVLSFGDRGFSECNLVDIFLRLDNGFNEESLGWFDIVDETEVEKEDEACRFYSCHRKFSGKPLPIALRGTISCSFA